MKPNIVFDLGNVLIHCDLDQCANALAARSRLTASEIRARLFVAEEIDPFDQGSLSGEAFTARVRELCEWEGSHQELETIWQQMLKADPEMFKLYEELFERGHKVYILSNINPFHTDWVLREHPAVARAHGRVFSCECAMIKPNEDIFRHLAQSFRLDPAESLFIDDRIDNIEAAERVGFVGLHHRNASETRQSIKKLLERFF